MGTFFCWYPTEVPLDLGGDWVFCLPGQFCSFRAGVEPGRLRGDYGFAAADRAVLGTYYCFRWDQDDPWWRQEVNHKEEKMGIGVIFNEDVELVKRLFFDLINQYEELAFGRPPVAVVPMSREVLLLAGEIQPGEEA